jgi:small neutral amino acid transporter SnatA (MarC family)
MYAKEYTVNSIRSKLFTADLYDAPPWLGGANVQTVVRDPAFKIAGGILLLRASLEMLQGSRATQITSGERAEGYQKEDISITPLAIPLLCGPVTIVTGILLSARATSWLHYPVLLGTVMVIYLINSRACCKLICLRPSAANLTRRR